MVNSRGKAQPKSEPATSANEHVLYERTAVHNSRLDDHDEINEIQDRRLDRIERVLDINDPEWRRL